MHALATPLVDGWAAGLELAFAQRGDRTVLAGCAHRGPLRVQRPFYPDGDASCHVYLLHPPGGVVGGDCLDVHLHVGPGAAALATTPGATRLYRSNGAVAAQRVHCRVAATGALEYLPQETIAFSGVRAQTRISADLEPGARFIAWEILALGRPAAGERFDRGALTSAIDLSLDGRPIVCERGRFAGGAPILDAAWGLAGHSVCGTMVCAGAAIELDALRAALAGRGDAERATVTALEDDVVLARYLGDDALAARECFEALRSVLRPALLGRPAIRPRIWDT